MAQPSQSIVWVAVCAGSVIVQPNFMVDVTVVVHCASGDDDDDGGVAFEHAPSWLRARKPSAGMRRLKTYIFMASRY